MPSLRAAIKLGMPHPRDWQHEKMPRVCPVGMGTAGNGNGIRLSEGDKHECTIFLVTLHFYMYAGHVLYKHVSACMPVSHKHKYAISVRPRACDTHTHKQTWAVIWCGCAGLGGKRVAGVPECGKRVVWKTRGLVENAGSDGKRGVPFSFFAKIRIFHTKMESQNFVSLYCNECQFSISAWNASRSKKQIKHFMRKKTIQEPTCRALVFFRGVYFIFHSNLRVFLLLKKK